jgi:phosphoenolpyruvate-protein kinase (PTS system EI component)
VRGCIEPTFVWQDQGRRRRSTPATFRILLAISSIEVSVVSRTAMAIQACRKRGKYVGICGQGPSDHPDFALWLLEKGIDSISLNPDTVLETWLFLAKERPKAKRKSRSRAARS